MLKLGRVTKEKVFFLVLVYVFNIDLFEVLKLGRVTKVKVLFLVLVYIFDFS